MLVIDKIQALYEAQGNKPYGEQVSQLLYKVQVAGIAERDARGQV